MKTWAKVLVAVVILLGVVSMGASYFHTHPVPVLQPAGEVGQKERNLILFALGISAIIVIPVFTLLIVFAWRYREGGRGRYDPKLEGNNAAEVVWWTLPAIIIAIISVVTWRSSYALDPFKPLSSQKPLVIQVVALDWKWLFIYPDENIARVNVVDIPVGRPVEFDLTSDAVMTSFWAPALGGQMYAMPGMTNKLNLEANKAGNYNGQAANISGEGFADMSFTVHALQPTVYDDWTRTMHRMPQKLDMTAYDKLAKPGTLTTAQVGMGKGYTYNGVTPDLFNTIQMQYMMPTGGTD